MIAFESIIGELEDALQDGEHARRVEMLRRVTNLFLDNAQGLDADQVHVFGDVLTHLTRQVENKALADLGDKLAPIHNAPNAVIQSLARHDEISVAGKVLSQSKGLTDSDLIEIARTKGQGHLGAISERTRLAEGVTDVIVERGDSHVVGKLSKNDGAAFSKTGFDTLAQRAENDAQLAVNLSERLDLPPDLLQTLMAQATDAVRARLKSLVPADTDIQQVLASASTEVLREVAAPRSFHHAESLISEMAESGTLNEQAVITFAEAGHYEEMSVGLARLCAAPMDLIRTLLQNPSNEGLLVACKAAGLNWKTVEAVLGHKTPRRLLTSDDIETARADYTKLATATAQRVFRFWLVRGVVGRVS